MRLTLKDFTLNMFSPSARIQARQGSYRCSPFECIFSDPRKISEFMTLIMSVSELMLRHPLN
jgi:hypothetical protein